MRILAVIILSPLLLGSCQTNERNETFKKMVKGCDKVDIIFYTHKDSLAFSTTDSAEIKIFIELISSENEKIADSCSPSGRLLYKQKEETILAAQFSTSSSNYTVNCDYVAYTLNGDNYKQRLTYSAGMFIDDVFSQINDR